MTQSIELLLDDDLDAAVRTEWGALKQAGLPSQARHTGPSNRPHVTLTVADAIPVPVEAGLGELADQVPLPVRLGSLVCFARRPGRVILVRLVMPSLALLHVQAAAAQAVGGLPGAGAYFEPGAWTPHVTLARDVRSEQLAVALEVLGELPDLTGEAMAVRRWDSIARRTWLLS